MTAKRAIIEQPLLSNGFETTAEAKQWLSNDYVGTQTDRTLQLLYNRKSVFCATHDEILHGGQANGELWRIGSDWLVRWRVRKLLEFSCCELLQLQTGDSGRGQIGNQGERECPPLEADTKRRQWKFLSFLWGGVEPSPLCLRPLDELLY
jgi:hypothetical protein